MKKSYQPFVPLFRVGRLDVTWWHPFYSGWHLNHDKFGWCVSLGRLVIIWSYYAP